MSDFPEMNYRNLKVVSEPAPERTVIPRSIPLLDAAEMFVRGEIDIPPARASMLKELLAYHASKRPVKNAPKEDTAIRLDKFIKARERTAKVIETGKAPTNPGAQVDDDAGSD